MPRPVAIRGGWAIATEMPIQVRAVDVMAGGGGRAGQALSIRHQEPGTRTGTEQNDYEHKQFSLQIPCICCLCSCSAAVKHAKIMQKITDSNLVCSFFESRNCWYVLVHTSTSQYIQVCIGMCLYELVCTGLYWYVLVYTDWLIYVTV